MDPKERDVAATLDKVFNPEHELLNSDVAVLSDLNRDGLAKFKNTWEQADLAHRMRLISKMVSLSEEDFILDFTGIFIIGLDDPEENVRIKALEGLEMEEKYVYAKPIIKTLKYDESTEVRATAARALGKLAFMAECGDIPEIIGQEIFGALLEVLENPREDDAVRRRALETIGCFHQEPVDRYIEDYYYSDDSKTKASAIFAMGLNCNPRWLSLLIEELNSERPEFKFEAARAAGEIGGEESVPHLIKLLDDNDQEVQEAAITSLGKIGGDEAKRTLQRLNKSTDARIKNAAKAALTELSACEDPLSLSF